MAPALPPSSIAIFFFPARRLISQLFFFSSRRRHTMWTGDWSSDVCSSDLAGDAVFAKRCAACHGQDGAGLAAAPDLVHGFIFPPLWGPNSFNDGAGMHRVLTAARFIKARMPLGSPDLNDDEALDVAAFINSKA